MKSKKSISSWRERFSNSRLAETLIFALLTVFVLAFHQSALQDRLLLILYAIGVCGALFVFVKRRSYLFAVMSATLAGSVSIANIYFHASADNWHPIIDPIRDVTALGILFFIVAKMMIAVGQIQKEDREAQIKRHLESQLVAMRAAALRSTSHEVRTPLSAIVTINETLLNGNAGPLTDMQKEFLGDIDQSARHLMSLVNDILDYAKAEVGMIELSPELVALVELVNQCITMVGPKAAEAGVSVTAQISPEVNEIVADPLRLKQILLNLLSNAIKYNERGGVVNVRVREDEGSVLISVRDTGRGIAEEHREHLFNPYYQASREDQSIGTGLGLAIIKHLTELHRGTITVDSVEGAGSVFTVRLPLRPEDAVETEDSANNQAGIFGELEPTHA